MRWKQHQDIEQVRNKALLQTLRYKVKTEENSAWSLELRVIHISIGIKM